MDPVTHTLTGALIGQAGLKRRTGLAMPALLVGANLPDIDVACFFWLDGVEHLAFRRGITHGPIAWVLLPLLLAGALWWFDRWQARLGTRPEGRLPVHFGWLYSLSFLACLTHPALDWLNVYGIRLLEPFSSRWFYGDVLFIVDVWLWAIMGVGLWLSLRREKMSNGWARPARGALTLAFAYILANGAITAAAERSIRQPDAYGTLIASPAPLAPWQREMLWIDGSERWVRAEWMPFGSPSEPRPLAEQQCLAYVGAHSDQFDAFWFWSRAPFFESSPTGGLLFRDARYYDPRAGNRFTVELAGFECAS